MVAAALQSQAQATAAMLANLVEVGGMLGDVYSGLQAELAEDGIGEALRQHALALAKIEVRAQALGTAISQARRRQLGRVQTPPSPLSAAGRHAPPASLWWTAWLRRGGGPQHASQRASPPRALQVSTSYNASNQAQRGEFNFKQALDAETAKAIAAHPKRKHPRQTASWVEWAKQTGARRWEPAADPGASAQHLTLSALL